MGQKYLVSGKTVSMRLWEAEPEVGKAPSRRDYETVGYVIGGIAELHLEGQTVRLEFTLSEARLFAFETK